MDRLMGRLVLKPLTIKRAREFVKENHRHSSVPVGGLFAVGAITKESEDLVGVAIVGRPVARLLQDGFTAEVTRLCTDGTKNACSMLYGSCWRAARALGYRRLVTYTQESELGTSLKASGWRVVAEVRAQAWCRPSRPRTDRSVRQKKLRWEAGEQPILGGLVSE